MVEYHGSDSTDSQSRNVGAGPRFVGHHLPDDEASVLTQQSDEILVASQETDAGDGGRAHFLFRESSLEGEWNAKC